MGHEDTFTGHISRCPCHFQLTSRVPVFILVLVYPKSKRNNLVLLLAAGSLQAEAFVQVFAQQSSDK